MAIEQQSADFGEKRSKLDNALNEAWEELTAPGANYALRTEIVRGYPMRCFVNAPATLRDLWFDTRQFAQRNYIIYRDERITYEDAHRITGSVAGWLAAQGLRPGDRVAIAMRNFPEWMLIYWACVSAGFVVVGMNAWWVSEEMRYAFADSKPKVVFCDGERLARLQPILTDFPDIAIVTVRTNPFDGGVTWQDVAAFPSRMPAVEIAPDDDACIFYTSGTTGHPKGAQLTHRSCANSGLCIHFAAQVQSLALSKISGVASDLGVDNAPVGLVTTPLFHVTANNCLAYPVTMAGGTLVLMYKWDAKEALRLVEAERITTLAGVPTMPREILMHPDAQQHDLSSLQTLVGGGAAFPPDLVAKIAEFNIPAVPSTGFGMTELSGAATANTSDFFLTRPNSVGRPYPQFEVKIIDDAGQSLPTGATGEICFRGAGVIKGYFNQPEATAEAIVEGWLHSGDMGHLDEEGFLYIDDRKKDMVLRGGENVYCAEVEAALYRHESVAEACVFGVADDRLGEEVGAAVLLLPGKDITAADLRDHVGSLLARHKVPRYIWIVSEPLPRGATGKFLRRELQATLDIRHA